MAEESLRELLTRLHRQLSANGRALDTESRQLLATAVRDIERALNPVEQPVEGAGSAAAAHTRRLESLAVRFEAGHPAVAEALRALVDALVKAGI